MPPEQTAMSAVVIIGAGQAGLQVAESLRSGGYAGTIDVFGNEPHLPYHRPPLSKAWLAGELEVTQLTMRSADVLARKNINLHIGVTATRIDRHSKHVILSDGGNHTYTHLVLATGASPRALSLPGGDAKGVLALRTMADANAMAERLAVCAEQQLPVVVVGGGFIGLEVAATARKKGIAVTVLEAAPRLLGRVLAPVLSDWYAKLHQGHGATLLLNARLQQIEVDASNSVTGLRMEDGTQLSAGLVVVGIGVTANDQLAREAGILCERGIVVDACGRSSDAAIFAAGDCAARKMPDGSLLRLESVQNATEQGKSVAASIMGQERPFTATPWFWSDQYDKKLQMAGLSVGATEWLLRGDMQSGSFSVYHLRAGNLLAVDSVNAAKDHMQARKLLDAKCTPTAAQIQDTGFDLSSLLH